MSTGTFSAVIDREARASTHVDDIACGLGLSDTEREAAEALNDVSGLVRWDHGVEWTRGRDDARQTSPPAAGGAQLVLSNADSSLSDPSGTPLRMGSLIQFRFADNLSVGALGAAIPDTTGTSVTMTAGHSVAAFDTLTIDSETLYVTAVSTNTLTVIRGWAGSTAATHSNGATVTRSNPRTLWTGHLDEPEEAPEIGVQETHLAALGTMSRLQAAQEISTEVYTDVTVDAALLVVCTAAGLPVGEFDFDESDVTLPYWWCKRRKPWDAVQELLASEGPGAALFEMTTGGLAFRSRASRLNAAASTTSQATFRGNSTVPNYTQIVPYHGAKDIVNRAAIAIETRTPSASGVIWEYGQDLELTPGEIVTITIELDDPVIDAIQPEAGTDYTTTSGFFKAVTGYSEFAPLGYYYPTLQQLSGTFITLTVGAGDGGLTLSGLQVRGTVLEKTSASVVENTYDASESVAEHGYQDYPLTPWPVMARSDAEDLANWIVFWYHRGRPVVEIETLTAEDGTLRNQQLTREIGDRVTVIEDNVPIDADYWIEHERGSLAAGNVLSKTWTMEKAFTGLGPKWHLGNTQFYMIEAVSTLAWVDATLANDRDNATLATCSNSSGSAAYSGSLQVELPTATRLPSGVYPRGMKCRILCKDSVATTSSAAKMAGTGATAGFGIAWTNPGNVTADDGSYATCTGPGTSQRLEATNFGFALPSGATIIGVYPEFKMHASSNTVTDHVYGPYGSGGYTNALIGLVYASAVIGAAHYGVPYDSVGTITSNLQFNGSRYAWYTADAWCDSTIVYDFDDYAWTENHSDLFSASLTPTIVNSSTFGFYIQCYISGTAIARVNAMRCTIYYRVGSTIYRVRKTARGVTGQEYRGEGALVPETLGELTFGGPTDEWDGFVDGEANSEDTYSGFNFIALIPNGNTLSVSELAIQYFYDEENADPEPLRSRVVRLGPSSYWRLDETSGTTAHDTQRAVDGTISGGVVVGASAIGGGKCCYRFDGASGYISMGDVYDFAGTAAFSVEFTMQPDSFYTGGNQPLLAKIETSGGSKGWNIVINSSGQIDFQRVTASGAQLCTSSVLDPARRHHIVCVYSGTEMSIYDNGVLAGGPTASTGSITGHTQPLYIGRNLFGTLFYAGKLEDVVIHSSALAAWQVLDHFEGTGIPAADTDYNTSVSGDSPNTYLKLTERSGNPADSGSSALSVTANGSPIYRKPGPSGGELDFAWELDGASQYLDLGDQYDSTGTNSLTVELWIKPTAAALTGTVDLVNKLSATDGWALRLVSGVPTFSRVVASATVSATGTTLVAGRWYHVVAIYNGSTIMVYVDNAAGTPVSSTGSLANTAANLNVGRSAASGNYYQGDVAKIAIWSSAITAQQVTDHYVAARPWEA